jgi:hypothetical protein
MVNDVPSRRRHNGWAIQTISRNTFHRAGLPMDNDGQFWIIRWMYLTLYHTVSIYSTATYESKKHCHSDSLPITDAQE